jgi:hypothetical protein
MKSTYKDITGKIHGRLRNEGLFQGHQYSTLYLKILPDILLKRLSSDFPFPFQH